MNACGNSRHDGHSKPSGRLGRPRASTTRRQALRLQTAQTADARRAEPARRGHRRTFRVPRLAPAHGNPPPPHLDRTRGLTDATRLVECPYVRGASDLLVINQTARRKDARPGDARLISFRFSLGCLRARVDAVLSARSARRCSWRSGTSFHRCRMSLLDAKSRYFRRERVCTHALRSSDTKGVARAVRSCR
jgi:hypothetical protein